MCNHMTCSYTHFQKLWSYEWIIEKGSYKLIHLLNPFSIVGEHTSSREKKKNWLMKKTQVFYVSPSTVHWEWSFSGPIIWIEMYHSSCNRGPNSRRAGTMKILELIFYRHCKNTPSSRCKTQKPRIPRELSSKKQDQDPEMMEMRENLQRWKLALHVSLSPTLMPSPRCSFHCHYWHACVQCWMVRGSQVDAARASRRELLGFISFGECSIFP